MENFKIQADVFILAATKRFPALRVRAHAHRWRKFTFLQKWECKFAEKVCFSGKTNNGTQYKKLKSSHQKKNVYELTFK